MAAACDCRLWGKQSNIKEGKTGNIFIYSTGDADCISFLELYVKTCHKNNSSKQMHSNNSEDDIENQLHQSNFGEEEEWETSQRKAASII
jgi:hypothetical protein